MRRVIPFLVLVIFTVFVREAVCLDVAPQVGKIGPPFELPDVNGKKITLADARGKVVLLNFWATWCGPCKEEMPSLNELFLALQKDGFIIFSISVDSSIKPVKSFLKKKKLAFPVLMDTEQEVYFDLYGILGLPTSLLIDREGIVREVIRGEREWNSPEMKKKIGRLLTNKKGDGK